MAATISLDPEALELLRMLDEQQPGSFSDFVRLFVAEAPQQVQKIEQALAAGDADALGKAAHYLRSAALAMGARDLVEACHALEHLSPGELGGAGPAGRLAELRHKVRDTLIALLQQVPQI